MNLSSGEPVAINSTADGYLAFIACYNSVVAAACSDWRKEVRLRRSPRELLEEYGIRLPQHVELEVVWDPCGDENVEAQVRSWKLAAATGRFTLFVPIQGSLDTRVIEEEELDIAVAGVKQLCIRSLI
ncbi:hypothetical protein ABZX92_40515 [Lentzea sp. NPDC006480]|uniref:hypothetical protein n=1 Tax=Lentzea sp. NPDC006480 TaxID=3157176 RepID=UPI0033B5F551